MIVTTARKLGSAFILIIALSSTNACGDDSADSTSKGPSGSSSAGGEVGEGAGDSTPEPKSEEEAPIGACMSATRLGELLDMPDLTGYPADPEFGQPDSVCFYAPPNYQSPAKPVTYSLLGDSSIAMVRQYLSSSDVVTDASEIRPEAISIWSSGSCSVYWPERDGGGENSYTGSLKVGPVTDKSCGDARAAAVEILGR